MNSISMIKYGVFYGVIAWSMVIGLVMLVRVVVN